MKSVGASIAFLAIALGISACTPTHASEASGPMVQHRMTSDEWPSRDYFSIDDRLFWIRIIDSELRIEQVHTFNAGPRAPVVAIVVPDQAASVVAVVGHSEDSFLIVTSAKDRERVINYDVSSREATEVWVGDVPDLVFGAHSLRALGALVIVGQTSCYQIGPGDTISEFEPLKSVESPWFFSSSAATDDSIALNLNQGLTVLSPGKPPADSLVAGNTEYVREIASVGDHWIAILAEYDGSGSSAIRLKTAESTVAVEKIPLQPSYQWRVTDYGDVALLWAEGAASMFFVGSDFINTVAVDPPLGAWGVCDGFQSRTSYAIDREGFRVIPIQMGDRR